MKTLHFKSKEAYRKWTAYGHMHTKKGLSVSAKRGRKPIMSSTGGYPRVVIHGRPHKVHHHN